ncbi:MAG: hypothetical protein IT242_07230 [Bacteroidia bacterium]|nr:hypothetical protein [Bacteroidia bacterium]
MKKSNRTLLVILLLLALASVYFLFRDNSSTVKKELRDFALRDTASISRIFLADRNGRTVLLERKGQDWLLNGKFPVRQNLLKSLMEAICRVDIKAGIPKAGYNTVVKDLASSGIKCEIYTNDPSHPEKVYYIGGHTQDGFGTYMMLENSSVPFITEIPGFNGFLTPRYSTNAADWKDPVVFRYLPDEIRSVSLNYPSYPDEGFSLIRNAGHFSLADIRGTILPGRPDSVKVENYLMLYDGLYYESTETSLSENQKDSILRHSPIAEILVRDLAGTEKGILLYPMAPNNSTLTLQDSLGHPLKYDLDRMTGVLQPQKEWVVVQHYQFDRLLRKKSDFTGRN